MPPKMRILVCGVLPPPCFGHSKMYEMLRASSFFRDFDTRFLNMHFWSYQTDKKVTLRKVGKMLKYYFQYIGQILSFRPKYILYNISFYKMPFLKDLLFCGAGILLGRKIVFHDFGQYVRELHETLPVWQKGLLRWMLRHSAASIVMGECVKKVYEGLMNPEKLFVVPGVVEDTRDLGVPPLEKRGPTVLYFSYMSKSKGIFVAFEAAVHLLQRRPDIRMIFGGPLENERVTERLKALQDQFPGRVEYLGYVEDVRERTRIFRGADVFIFPTLRDVFGLVLLHAMAEGLPVVASAEGSVPEIVQDGKTGFLVPKGDVMALAAKTLALLDSPHLRQEMSLAARARFFDYYDVREYEKRMRETFLDIDALLPGTRPFWKSSPEKGQRLTP